MVYLVFTLKNVYLKISEYQKLIVFQLFRHLHSILGFISRKQQSLLCFLEFLQKCSLFDRKILVNWGARETLNLYNFLAFSLSFPFIIIIIIIIINTIVIELTHSKTVLENTVEMEPQPVALHFKNLSQYSSRSK